MKAARLGSIILLVIVAIGCGNTVDQTGQVQPSPGVSPGQATPGPTDEIAVARKTFEQRCAGCHGVTGQGGAVKVEGKELNVPNLSSEHAREHSDQELIDQITNGGNGMPPFKDKLGQEEIAALVRFIRQEFQK